MFKDYTDTFLLNSLDLPNIQTMDELANHLALSNTIIYLLSAKNQHYYTKFYLTKPNGGKREILSPSPYMKLVQKWILKNILYKIKVSEEAMAYKRASGNALLKSANIHCGNLYILVIDIKDFFRSISREKVFYFFRRIGYNVEVSNILSNICTYNGALPQGGVTSPYLSNLICYKLDKRIMGFCSKRDMAFSRYADDLIFSSNNKEHLKKNYNVLKEILEDEGFLLNKEKTRYLSPNSRKRILGITVNDGKAKAPKELKRKVRAMIFRSIVTENYSKNPEIIGYISFISSIEPGYKEKVIDYLNSFQKKDISYSEAFIDSYNNNKILKSAKDLEFDEPLGMRQYNILEYLEGYDDERRYRFFYK